MGIVMLHMGWIKEWGAGWEENRRGQENEKASLREDV